MYFSNLMSNPVEMIIWMAVMAIAGFLCATRHTKQIEKVSKVMMILLLAFDYYSCDKQVLLYRVLPREHKVLPCA